MMHIGLSQRYDITIANTMILPWPTVPLSDVLRSYLAQPRPTHCFSTLESDSTDIMREISRAT